MQNGLEIIDISAFKKFKENENTRIRKDEYKKMFDVLNKKYESLRYGLDMLIRFKHQLSKQDFKRLYNQHIRRLKHYEFVLQDLQETHFRPDPFP